ncbi:MAG: VWA domain-containing protein [Phycisphaerae bacterium]
MLASFGFHYGPGVLALFAVGLIVALVIIWWRWRKHDAQTALRYSSVEFIARQPTSMGVKLRHLIPLLRSLAVVVLVVCLARPEKGDEQTRVYAEGIALQMVVDLSGSMESPDFVLDGQRATRLDAVKQVFATFVKGDGEALKGRPDDLVGLIGFARYADSLAPLTLDHDNVLAILQQCETAAGPSVQRRRQELQNSVVQAQARRDQRLVRQLKAEWTRLAEEDATAIGDGLALAIERLRDLDRRPTAPNDSHKIKSKVIILLTDGETNAGDLTPEQAATLAKASGIKVYAIGIGSRRRGGALVDEKQMRAVTQTTGGQFFKAVDTRALHNVYAEIDKLEKTQTEERRFLQYTQAATTWTTWGRWRLPPLLLIVVGLLVLEVVLANTRLRKIP